MRLPSCYHFRINRRPLGKKRKTVSKTDAEEVYPIHCLDQPTTVRQSMRTWVMCFNDVLMAPRLHEALCHLLEMGDWKKLGTRLRIRKDGLLEAYAPKNYSHENPACTFFFDAHYDCRVESHPAGMYFSRSSQRAFTQTYPAKFPPAMMHPEFPTTVQEIIDRKLPQLILHILAFSNATLVTISMPANMMDQAGFKSLLENWSLVLAGRQEGVALVYGPYKDVLQELVRQAQEKGAVERVEAAGEAFRHHSTMTDWWRRRRDPAVQRRMVYVPKAILDELLGQMRRDIARILEDEDQWPRPIVSDAVLLLAWLTKLQGGDGGKTRAVTARIMFNLRHRLSLLRDPSGDYLQTLTLPVLSTLVAEDVAKSAGHIALLHKRNVDGQTSEHRLLSLAATMLERKKGGRESFRGRARVGGAASLDYCNLTWLHLLSAADFSPAVLPCGKGGLGSDGPRYNAPGTMTTAYALDAATRRPRDAMCQVIGKDSKGHLWMLCQLEPDVWVRLEEELYRLQKGFHSPVSGNSPRFESIGRW
ncbi:hypothetical protein E4U42_000420 [Claviceps africana]|uniref:Uncharacterized protein n=1 Tax=Claviceps africana TaxID=83212 RepID=A0A8K0NFL6_9HYPO|nr:hypothetical protein E4U42_000420 [Claviceps africana]